MPPSLFPFTAVVGQDTLRRALILNAINPLVGGVLVRGEKGTAKSTLARALAELLPPILVVPGCPYQCDPDAPFADCPNCTPLQAQGPLPRVERPMRVITLPVNASEDRVCGALDLETTLRTGIRRFEPGMLADVHRGILYVDEVNLLDDHIVDILLDVAAMGVNTVEREGVRMTHPSRFILIGTMNPEEGDLRPQLLDRFGLCVEVNAILDVEARMEIVRRRLAWETAPQTLTDRFAPQQSALAAAIQAARARLTQVAFGEAALRQISELCVRLQIHSHRADIVIARAAQTLAAWEGRAEILTADLQRAAELALPHRFRRRPFEETRLHSEQISQALQDSSLGEEPPNPENPSPQQQEGQLPAPPAAQDSTRQHGPRPEENERVFEIAPVAELTLPDPPPDRLRRKAAGRKNESHSQAQRGRSARAELPSGKVAASDVALEATLRAAAPQQTQRPTSAIAINVQPPDVRVKVRQHAIRVTVVFVVDASGSMGARQRMTAAKGVVLSLLKDAYVRRDRVALIAFRKQSAEILLQPTDSSENALIALKKLPTGGQTPLSHGLMKAWELQQQVLRRDATAQMLVVLLSDGKANVFYQPNSAENPHAEAVALARQLTANGTRLLVLDTEDDFLTLGLARDLAEAANADYIKLAAVEASAIEQSIRGQIDSISE